MAGTLTFAAGETVKSFDVATIDNDVLGPSRSFGATISAPTNGYLLNGSSWFVQGRLRMVAVAGLIGRRQDTLQLSAAVS